MESIVTQSSDGFKNGEFLYAQTKTLPWPKFNVYGSAYDLHSSDLLSTLIGGSTLANALPNAFEAGGFFSSSGTGQNKYINKYDSTGSIEWTYPFASLWSMAEKVFFLHFYDDGVTKWAIGYAQNSSSHSRLFKISLDGQQATISDKIYTNNHYFKSMVTLEDGTLYYTMTYSESYLYHYTYRTDLETLSEGGQVPGLGYFTGYNTQNYSSIIATTCFFKGSVQLVKSEGTGGNTDAVVVNIAVNADLTFNESQANKVLIKTWHPVALGSFFGQLYQLSKNTFYAQPLPRHGASTYPQTSFNAKFYTRKELETWLSNCIYATTGLCIAPN
ncbi:hypothetical protein [Pseudoalteromonas sp. Ps84H-4]|uniref:hypothetical protein n=1 Tax=Pseudoalteromonas sp. Ps84H-4 TaxID=2954502 RepID=UPI002097DAE4|nr:hypothetical protein [Pseudoalteromonas sp. Ps84H-4]MCO7251380.1 hypothetical protein [Pseudoalteromonas sp. Ps84H-4]